VKQDHIAQGINGVGIGKQSGNLYNFGGVVSSGCPDEENDGGENGRYLPTHIVSYPYYLYVNRKQHFDKTEMWDYGLLRGNRKAIIS
jgi:hypothetical protein